MTLRPFLGRLAVLAGAAVTVRSATSLSDARGVAVRHAAFSGVSSTQEGRRTRRSLEDQPPPTAEAKSL